MMKAKLNIRLPVLIAVFLSVLFLSACEQKEASEIEQKETPEMSVEDSASSSESITELQIIDIEVGSGATAVAGQTVIVHYTGWLYAPETPDNKGSKFDSSVDRGEPFAFPLGGGRVIKGWDQGVDGMQIGGKRRLIIPAHLGYGDRGAGAAIPPGATLMFDVELLDLK
jgi:FKBP-type peptidyl-prolyl cis-trans isomerase FkpA